MPFDRQGLINPKKPSPNVPRIGLFSKYSGRIFFSAGGWLRRDGVQVVHQLQHKVPGIECGRCRNELFARIGAVGHDQAQRVAQAVVERAGIFPIHEPDQRDTRRGELYTFVG